MSHRVSELFAIRGAVPRRARLALAIASWALIVALWYALTHWDVLPPFSLPRPAGVIQAIGRLWTEYDLLGNVLKSWWRIAQAFLWCAVIAIPLGTLMAGFGWLREFINPVAAPMRAMPIT